MSERLAHHFLTNFTLQPYPWKVYFYHKLIKTDEQLPKGCIIDIETTGLDPEKDKIIAIGLLKDNRANIFQLTNTQYERFRAFSILTARSTPRPRYAYAAHFEADFLRIKHGWQDLTQYGEREYEDLERGPHYRLHLDQVTVRPFKRHDIPSQEVPSYWQRWLNTKKPKNLFEITFHCLCDLLRTRQLITKHSSIKLG